MKLKKYLVDLIDSYLYTHSFIHNVYFFIFIIQYTEQAKNTRKYRNIWRNYIVGSVVFELKHVRYMDRQTEENTDQY